MIHTRWGGERGQTRLSWLDSRHTFSFGAYYDPRFLGISDLVAINDDRVGPGAGFSTHPHRDMEIISYVLEGCIEHRDTMDTHSRLRAGEVQVMSAGTGVRHSEYNASASDELRFLQIWIRPDKSGYSPHYAQRDFSAARGITLLVSPDGREGSLPIRQDAAIHQLRFEGEAQVAARPDRIYYLQVARGQLTLNGQSFDEGDGASISEAGDLQFQGSKGFEGLLLDLRKA